MFLSGCLKDSQALKDETSRALWLNLKQFIFCLIELVNFAWYWIPKLAEHNFCDVYNIEMQYWITIPFKQTLHNLWK